MSKNHQKRNKPNLDEIDRRYSTAPMSAQASLGVLNITDLFAKLNPIGVYPLKRELINQINKDLQDYRRLPGSDPWAEEQCDALLSEIKSYEFDESPRHRTIDLKRSQFHLCEAFRATTPSNCIGLLILKASLLKAILRETHPEHLCRSMARQIRLSCRENDARRGLFEEQNTIFESHSIECDQFIAILTKIAIEELDFDTVLHRRHSALFRAITEFFQYSGEPYTSQPTALNTTASEHTDSSDTELIELQTKLQELTTLGISKNTEGETFRWLANVLKRVPFSTVRFNQTERYELIANLNDLADSESKDDRLTALLISLMYSCGMTVREVTLSITGNTHSLSDDGHYLRKLRRPSDAGKVAHTSLCEPQSDVIKLPLPDLTRTLFNEFLRDAGLSYFHPQVNLREHANRIKERLREWREFGRYRLTMPRIVAALPTELSVRTQHPTLIFLLASRPNHCPPTVSYYAGLSHQQLLETWNEAQRGLYSYE